MASLPRPLAIFYGGLRVSLDPPENMLGRSSSNAIPVDSSRASRQHAVLRWTGDELSLEDLGSRNGTYVNERKIKAPVVLRVGDRIRIGGEVMQVVSTTDTDVETLRRRGTAGPVTPVKDDTVRRAERFPEDDDDGDTTTMEGGSALDVLEILIESAAGTSSRENTAKSVRRTLDDLLDAAGISAPRLTPEEAERVADAADVIVGWFPQGSLDEWRLRLYTRLGAATTGGWRRQTVPPKRG